MKYDVYYHGPADKKIPSQIFKEVEEVIRKCSLQVGSGMASKLRRELINGLTVKGWPKKIRIDATSKISVTSIKKNVGLCLQTGNMGRIYADLLKLQTIYLKDKIQAGILILAAKRAAFKMGKNIANSERLIGELSIFDRTITIPLIIIGIRE